MPNIIEYNATGEINPSDKGIQAAEQAARVYGNTGEDIGRSVRKIGDQVEQHMAVMETSELYKTGTELKQNLQKRYEQESTLPENRNDPHFGDRFMAEVGPQLDQWGSGVNTDHGKMLATTLKANIRNEIFNHVAAGQSEMDAAHVEDNLTQTMNTLGAGLIIDPSRISLDRTLGAAKDAVQGMTMSIPNVGIRERVASELLARYLPQLVMSSFQGKAESAKNQIADTGGATSPAAEQLGKDVAAQVGFQYLSPEAQVRVSTLQDEAVKQGQQLYKSRVDSAKSQVVEQGKAAFAEIHNKAMEYQIAGLPMPPELVQVAQDYARKYGSTNPGESSALDDFILRGAKSAQGGDVQPYNPKTRNDIQATIGTKGGPDVPTLTKYYNSGQITLDDLNHYTELLGKLNKPETDPTFGPAYESFKRWQGHMIESIGVALGGKGPGVGPARAQFIHDSEVWFMGRGRAQKDWGKALNDVTDVHNAASFAKLIPYYERAANRGVKAQQYMRQNFTRFNEDGSTTHAFGSTANPVYPVKGTPAQPTKIDQATVDKIRGL